MLPFFSCAQITLDQKAEVYTVMLCCCHIFPSFLYLHAFWWDSLKPTYFSLPCLHLWEDTQCVTIDQFSPQNSVLALPLLNSVVVLCMARLVTESHCWPLILVCLHIVCIFGNTRHDLAGAFLFYQSVLYFFTLCMVTWLVSICCLPV
jgi:hypothetical protein